jgi:hypothetical protein
MRRLGTGLLPPSTPRTTGANACAVAGAATSILLPVPHRYLRRRENPVTETCRDPAGDQPDPYEGPGDDELPLPVGESHVWTEGVSTDGEDGQ